MALVHLVWFRRTTGQWIGEWKGLVPEPDIDPTIIGDERLRLMNAWQQRIQSTLGPRCLPGEQEWNLDEWDACPSGGAVCLDVTRFGWPIGDHAWHRWDDPHRMLDWGDEHTFIEIRTDTMEIVANQRSHRPIRDAVPGQHVVDITHTQWARFYGRIFGRFIWREGEQRWSFMPSGTEGCCAPKELAEAPIDLGLGVEKESVYHGEFVQRARH